MPKETIARYLRSHGLLGLTPNVYGRVLVPNGDTLIGRIHLLPTGTESSLILLRIGRELEYHRHRRSTGQPAHIISTTDRHTW
jgi:hypothetical protein